MVISIVLAQIFSIYLIVLGLAFILNQKYYRTAILEIINNESLNTLSSVFTLVLGILLITFHNIWVLAWPLIITLLAWIVFIKGVIRLMIPKKIYKWTKALINNKRYFFISNIIMIILGLILAYYGFFVGVHYV